MLLLLSAKKERKELHCDSWSKEGYECIPLIARSDPDHERHALPVDSMNRCTWSKREDEQTCGDAGERAAKTRGRLPWMDDA
jgi:hypothetical protein